MIFNFFKIDRWSEVIIYICSKPKNGPLFLSIISKDLNTVHSHVSNIINELESLKLIKTEKVGRIKKISFISEDCLILARDLIEINEVLDNARKKREQKINSNTSADR